MRNDTEFADTPWLILTDTEKQAPLLDPLSPFTIERHSSVVHLILCSPIFCSASIPVACRSRSFQVEGASVNVQPHPALARTPKLYVLCECSMKRKWYSLPLSVALAALLPGAEYIRVRTAAARQLRRLAQLPCGQPVTPATARARLLELLPPGSSMAEIDLFLTRSQIGWRRSYRDANRAPPGLRLDIDPGPSVLNLAYERFSILFQLDAKWRLVDIIIRQEVS
jgi:hypothetical protein